MTTRLLAVDTASEICGVALAVDAQVTSELILNQGATHTRSVMTAVDAVLQASRVTIEQIDAYVVTRGPGSFTGLRIGISTAKGLAAAYGKPMVGVSSLDVLAHQATGDGPLICSLMDARRNEVYWRLYRREGQDLSPLTPAAVGPVAQIVPLIDATCRFIGNGTGPYRETLESQVGELAQWTRREACGLRPSMLARLGWERFSQGAAQDLEALTPIYLRISDAELNRGNARNA